MEQKLYDYVIERLAATRGKWPAVADGSGLSKRTLEKIARKEIPSPNVHHVQKLADYFHSQESNAA